MTMNVSLADAKAIQAIAEKVGNEEGLTVLNVAMDLTATHANGNPLRLAEMLIDASTSKSASLLHDVYGIRRHLNRHTGKLGENFTPRYSATS